MTRQSTARKPLERSRAIAKVRRSASSLGSRAAGDDAAYIASVHDPLDTSIPFLLRRTSRYFRLGMQNRLRQYDLGFSHWFFLRALWLKDGITQRELCQRIEAPEPAAVSALRELERQRYVRRVRDKDNKRKILVFITPKGHALREKLLPHAYELASMGVRGIPNREVAMLRSLLNRIRDNMIAALQDEMDQVDT
jgi:DNA-binding MarR family transcriptional regulator